MLAMLASSMRERNHTVHDIPIPRNTRRERKKRKESKAKRSVAEQNKGKKRCKIHRSKNKMTG